MNEQEPKYFSEFKNEFRMQLKEVHGKLDIHTEQIALINQKLDSHEEQIAHVSEQIVEVKELFNQNTLDNKDIKIRTQRLEKAILA